MYLFYMDGVVLPITPPKVKTQINNQNETITLINEGEANLLRDAGLTDIEFKCELPQSDYPFINEGAKSPDFYMDMFEKLKTSKKPFTFIITRSKFTKKLHDTNMKVSLEDYSLEEDAENGFDIIVNIKLKQYRSYGTRTATVKVEASPSRPSNIIVTSPAPRPSGGGNSGGGGGSKEPYIGCTCTVNGVLHRDSYGNGAGQTRTNYEGKINFINKRGSHPYHITTPSGGWQGWVLASAVSNVR